MRVRPTELGVKGMLLLAALELAFLATSYSNLFFLLIAFCCVLGAVGLLGAIANVRGVDVRSLVVPFAAAGDARRVELTLVIAGDRRRFDLAFTLDDGRERSELGWVPVAEGSGVHTLPMAGRSRGVFAAQSLLVATRHPFGLFQATRRIRINTDVVTHPAPSHAEDAAVAGIVDAEAVAAGAPSVCVAGLREFRGGDTIRDLHWKATARRGVPVVKEREPDEGSRIDVVIDRRCSPEELERALSTAAAFVVAPRSGGGSLHLRSQGFAVEVSATGDSRTTASRWLAGASVLPPDAGEPPAARAGSLLLPANGSSGRSSR